MVFVGVEHEQLIFAQKACKVVVAVGHLVEVPLASGAVLQEFLVFESSAADLGSFGGTYRERICWPNRLKLVQGLGRGTEGHPVGS